MTPASAAAILILLLGWWMLPARVAPTYHNVLPQQYPDAAKERRKTIAFALATGLIVLGCLSFALWSIK
jgi:uncharacterized iron-regulated membrane protein